MFAALPRTDKQFGIHCLLRCSPLVAHGYSFFFPFIQDAWRDVWEIVGRGAQYEKSIWRDATQAQFKYFKPWKWSEKENNNAFLLNAFEWLVGEVELRTGCEKTEANIRRQDYWATDWSLRDFPGRWRAQRNF